MKAVTFHWAAVTNDAQGDPLPPEFVVTYKVFACLSSQNFPTTPVATTTELSAHVAMPSAGAYKACVVASGPDGDSGQSTVQNFSSVALIPATPTGFGISPN